MRKLAIFLVALFIFTFLTPSVFAQPQRMVLGASTEQLSMPPTIEGPGFLLPDNPLYFLDAIKQQLRLFFAPTADAKANVYTAIAGERLAEMRVELQKGNMDATEVALQGVKDNSKAAARVIADAKFAGHNMSETAKDVNEILKRRLQLLDVVDMQATGEMRAELDAADMTLSNAKMQVEDSLPEALLTQEIQYDMTRDIARNLTNTQDSAELLTTEIAVLQKEASQAAALSLSHRQQAVNTALSEQQRALLTEQQQQDSTQYKLRSSLAKQAADIVSRAQQAAQTFQGDK